MANKPNVGRPLASKAHPAPLAAKRPIVASTTHSIVDGSKHVNKPINAHNQNPGFGKKVM